MNDSSDILRSFSDVFFLSVWDAKTPAGTKASVSQQSVFLLIRTINTHSSELIREKPTGVYSFPGPFPQQA